MQNPWNFIIPTLKVSVTKVQGFFVLSECNFQTSFQIMMQMMKWATKWWNLEEFLITDQIHNNQVNQNSGFDSAIALLII